jgi:hypothetical protein
MYQVKTLGIGCTGETAQPLNYVILVDRQDTVKINDSYLPVTKTYERHIKAVSL